LDKEGKKHGAAEIFDYEIESRNGAGSHYNFI
jgi:hypothetical protein